MSFALKTTRSSTSKKALAFTVSFCAKEEYVSKQRQINEMGKESLANINFMR